MLTLAMPRRFSCSSSRSRNATCPDTSLTLAVAHSTHSARSTSGKLRITPDPLGHSISNSLLRTLVVSKPASTAYAVILLPLDCLIVPSATRSPTGKGDPISSRNSRAAATSGSSPSSYSPLGIDQPRSSFLAQNGRGVPLPLRRPAVRL